MDNQLLTLQVTDGLTVAVIQDQKFEFLMPTKDVALGYGVADATVRSHMNQQKQELLENVHFVKGVQKTNTLSSSVGISNARTENLQTNQTYWTKAGVIRLGFFIKSERAKLFRDWAEQIILTVTAPAIELPKATKRNHNRLTPDRLLEMALDFAEVEDKELRLRLINKYIKNINTTEEKQKTTASKKLPSMNDILHQL